MRAGGTDRCGPRDSRCGRWPDSVWPELNAPGDDWRVSVVCRGPKPRRSSTRLAATKSRARSSAARNPPWPSPPTPSVSFSSGPQIRLRRRTVRERCGQPGALRVEAELRFPQTGGRHAGSDCLVQTPSTLIGIESRRSEPLQAACASGPRCDACGRRVLGRTYAGRTECVRDNLHVTVATPVFAC